MSTFNRMLKRCKSFSFALPLPEFARRSLRRTSTIPNDEELSKLQAQSADGASTAESSTIILQEVDRAAIESFVCLLERREELDVIREFDELQREQPNLNYPALTCREPQHRIRNRYKDVLCYDHSRVPLSGSYIHASYVDGYMQQKEYICTQGPLPNTIVDFWRMVWQEQASLIVMLTQLVEFTRTKCEIYYPDRPGYWFSCKPFEIMCLERHTHEDYTRLDLLVTHKTLKQNMLVTHCTFLGWLDNMRPSVSRLIGFMDQMRLLKATLHENAKNGRKSGPAPMVVHCSAGVGRTATYVTLDLCIRELQHRSVVDVKSVVRKVRTQRKHAVATSDQYLFLHDALLEYGKSLVETAESGIPNIFVSHIRQ